MKSVLLAGFFAFLGLVLAFDWHTRRADPVIEGKRMGVWALNLVREPYGRDEYRIRPEYMRVFKMDREAAIPALMKAVAKRYSKGRILWSRFAQFLPKRLEAALRPKTTYPGNRWAGVLALSNLAREKPDARIPAFFLECMQDSNVALRKIAAYEAGPWLDPEHPETAVKILRLPLAVKSPQVRRDACRRIAASKTDGNYVNALRELLPKFREMNVELTPEAPRALATIAK